MNQLSFELPTSLHRVVHQVRGVVDPLSHIDT